MKLDAFYIGMVDIVHLHLFLSQDRIFNVCWEIMIKFVDIFSVFPLYFFIIISVIMIYSLHLKY